MSEILESQDAILEWATGAGLRIVLVVAAGLLASIAVGRIVHVAVRPRLLATPLQDSSDPRLRRRERTVESFLIRSANTFIAFATVMVVLSEVGVNVVPLIASASIVGVAVGLGAQTLVRDAIAGVFLLLENHYDLGDRVRLAGVEGEVIAISLRRTTIRDDDGAVHTIPNGAITVTSNLSEVSSEPPASE